ncbi:1690_t:CDS:2, partial [Scutellospora calospora]
SSENGSPIALIVLGYAYREGKFRLEQDLDKGKKYLECASERGNEKATEIINSFTSKRNAYLYNIVDKLTDTSSSADRDFYVRVGNNKFQQSGITLDLPSSQLINTTNEEYEEYSN